MEKIILINDSKFESIIMKDMLSNLKYEVIITNEYGALAKIKNVNPDIVICNLIMKDITGDKLIKNIKAINKNIICILSSSNEIKLEDYPKKYIDEIIHIPVKKEELVAILNKFLHGNDNENSENPDNSSDGFAFCPYCGQKLDRINNNFLFCPFCGKKIK
ncbi:response regulator [Clostridium sp. P21]|uniref:Stage 0 sporulation protein A homolog n=1 Tax=Clostridium muellerianum TaxID=2716538 RepID=A0A7Y0EL58_9CLOT|nr:response regulator [Clostridium muellerianum]NMM65437.1 response regulator [Clostridium muellerianum]